MGRKSKHSVEEKIAACEAYDKGEAVSVLAASFEVSEWTISNWVSKFRQYGSQAFMPSNHNRSYSKEFKDLVVQAYLNGEGSLIDVCLKYNISSKSMLTNWVTKYNNHIENEDYEPKGEAYMIQSRKTTFEEREKIVKHCLKNNRKYTQTALDYKVSYAQVYQWVKKYEEQGVEGLEDRRGKRKIEEDLSEVEILERKVNQLQRQLELKDNEVTLLKKVKEIERRRNSKK